VSFILLPTQTIPKTEGQMHSSSPESFPESNLSEQSASYNLQHLESLPYSPTKILPDAIENHFLSALRKGRPDGQHPL
jgi:hypothetical protein